MGKNSLTAHIMIKNEENFIEQAINSVKDVVDKIIIYDTGSNDHTVPIIRSMHCNKIVLHEKKVSSAFELTDIRNKMIDETQTEWFILVDGDEVYNSKELLEVKKGLLFLSEAINRVVVFRKNLFYPFKKLFGKKQMLGRIYRTKNVIFVGDYPNENPSFLNNKKLEENSFSVDTKNPVLYHYHSFPRSSLKNSAKVKGT